MPREPVRPATDVMLTILPARRGIITRPTAWQQRKTPVRFVPTMASHSRRGSWSSGKRMRYPALFTRRSTWPNSRTVSATTRSTWAASCTSHDRVRERRPKRAHLAGRRLDRREPAPAGHHVRARLRELDGDGPADPLSGSGHDRDAIL